MAIEIIEGLPGGGKTLFATRRILEARRAGRDVLCNFHSKKNIWRFGLWDEFLRAENSLCVIDEAQMWLGSRSWGSNSVDDLAVFQQSRKNGLDLICIAQHHKRIDVAVRELVAYQHLCKKVLGKFISVKTYTPDDLNKPIGRVAFPIQAKLYDHYWTFEKIGGRDGKGYKFGAASTGGVVELVNGQFTANRCMFVVEGGSCFSVPISEKERTWMHLSRYYNHSRNGKFFFCRDYALIEGKEYEVNTPAGAVDEFKIWDQLMDTKLASQIGRLEDKVFGRLGL